MFLVNSSHLHCSIGKGTKIGKIWATLKDDDAVKPLTAILTLNTIAHTMGAAGVGSEVQKLYGEDSLTLASVLLTLVVLFLSEIIPKTLWELLTGNN